MIVTIAGTSGAGKSTLARAFCTWLEGSGAKPEEREIPVPYRRYDHQQVLDKPLCVLGRYDSPTGGCDTIKNVEQVFAAVRVFRENGCHVLYEGLFVMNMTRGPELAAEAGPGLVVLQLTTPLATCVSSIDMRRAERGAGELASTKNTKNNYRRANNYCAKMRDAGARVIKVDRAQALGELKELLGK